LLVCIHKVDMCGIIEAIFVASIDLRLENISLRGLLDLSDLVNVEKQLARPKGNPPAGEHRSPTCGVDKNKWLTV
jgi:hypothetical protein